MKKEKDSLSMYKPRRRDRYLFAKRFPWGVVALWIVLAFGLVQGARWFAENYNIAIVAKGAIK